MSERRFKKIVVMGNEVDRLGGIGRFMNQVAIEFFDRGYEVEMVGIAPPPDGHFQPMQRPAGIAQQLLMSSQIPEEWTLRTRAHHWNPARRRRYAKRMSLRAEAVAKLKVLLPQWGPDTLILCTQVYGMEHLLEAGYDSNDPQLPRVIGQYHGSAREARHVGDMRRVLRAYTDVERFICLSPVDAEEFRRAGLNNVGWIANPVAVPEHGAETQRKVFMSLGRYDPIKSLDLFIRAWAQIADQLPQWSAELYGEGAERETLQKLIDEQGIPRVSLMGKTDKVGHVLASTSVHVLSSQNEGLPIAIVEAGLLGVPTVSFDCAPGISVLVEDGVDGYIVDQNDVSGLAQRMLELGRDEQLLSQMSGAVASSSRRFLPENIMSEWDAEIAELSL
ncbi:glycosyltransferase [Galactobacter caseinivorans]|uniref:Glycosyltransferase n=1 Tax=Galactobacter caseinivorans TaxID=2676123 RepID=A0A496PGS9_9MICC|nr:glycosyltransferase [Galactobacter caseinivorans]RKW69688.1 glycosyltransferase [Galactobacter caseinivorans]